MAAHLATMVAVHHYVVVTVKVAVMHMDLSVDTEVASNVQTAHEEDLVADNQMMMVGNQTDHKCTYPVEGAALVDHQMDVAVVAEEEASLLVETAVRCLPTAQRQVAHSRTQREKLSSEYHQYRTHGWIAHEGYQHLHLSLSLSQQLRLCNLDHICTISAE